MGTRNSTMVILNEEIKVAQYGQWDGNPSGQGLTVLEFCRKADWDKFKFLVVQLQELTDEDCIVLNSLIKESGKSLYEMFPEHSRDTAAKILNLIYEGKIWNNKLGLNKNFIEDKLFCEWVYIIDLDKMQLQVRNGADKDYSLFDLPTDEEFLKLEQDDRES